MILEEGMAADTEDNTTGVRKKKGKQRKSWLGGYRQADSVEAHQMEPTTSGSAGDRSMSPSDDLHNQRSGTPGVHTYPPTSPDRRSVDSHHSSEDVINQAARVLKTAVLHDARNIKGKEAGTDGLAFSITSPHEAKVIIHNSQKAKHLLIYSCRNWRAIYTLRSELIENGHILSRLTFIPRIPSLKKPKKPSKYLTVTETRISLARKSKRPS